MCKKNIIPISICFCVIAIQIFREILKKYRKTAITLQQKCSKIWETPFLDSHMRNIVSKFQCYVLTSVANIDITYIHTHILQNLGNAWKKFAVIDNARHVLVLSFEQIYLEDVNVSSHGNNYYSIYINFFE